VTSEIKWNPAADLPERGLRLVIELTDGRVIDGICPMIDASHRTNPDWRDMQGNRLNEAEVLRWARR